MSVPTKLSEFAGPEGLCVVGTGGPDATDGYVVMTAAEWAKVEHGRDAAPGRRPGRLPLCAIGHCEIVGPWRPVGRAGTFAPARYVFLIGDSEVAALDVVNVPFYGGLASQGKADPLPEPQIVRPAPVAATPTAPNP